MHFAHSLQDLEMLKCVPADCKELKPPGLLCTLTGLPLGRFQQFSLFQSPEGDWVTYHAVTLAGKGVLCAPWDPEAMGPAMASHYPR